MHARNASRRSQEAYSFNPRLAERDIIAAARLTGERGGPLKNQLTRRGMVAGALLAPAVRTFRAGRTTPWCR